MCFKSIFILLIFTDLTYKTGVYQAANYYFFLLVNCKYFSFIKTRSFSGYFLFHFSSFRSWKILLHYLLMIFFQPAQSFDRQHHWSFHWKRWNWWYPTLLVCRCSACNRWKLRKPFVSTHFWSLQRISRSADRWWNTSEKRPNCSKFCEFHFEMPSSFVFHILQWSRRALNELRHLQVIVLRFDRIHLKLLSIRAEVLAKVSNLTDEMRPRLFHRVWLVISKIFCRKI